MCCSRWVLGILLLSAFQIPGWVNDIKPTTMTLNSGLLYHLVKRDTGFDGAAPALSTSGSICLSDMMDYQCQDAGLTEPW